MMGLAGPLAALRALGWRRAALLATGAFVAVHLAWIDPRLRAERDAARAAHTGEVAAHRATVAGVRAASLEAQRLAEAEVARVRARQDAITREITDDFEARVADARARAAARSAADAAAAGGLRGESRAGAGHGGARAAGLPGPGAAARRAGEAPGEDRLPAASNPGLDPADALIATEQAIQLDALIDWVTAQAAVQVGGMSTTGERP